MSKDQKTRNGRCMKLNKPWTGPWKVIKRLGEVVYRIKYVGHGKVGLKRRIVHHNQLKDITRPRIRTKRLNDQKQLSYNQKTTMIVLKTKLMSLSLTVPNLVTDQSCLTMENKLQESLRRTL